MNPPRDPRWWELLDVDWAAEQILLDTPDPTDAEQGAR